MMVQNAVDIVFKYNLRGSDDQMKKMIYENTEIELCGQILQNSQSWGYVPMFERDYNDFKATRCVKMSGYTHPIVHQMPDMAFKSGIFLEIQEMTNHNLLMPAELFAVGFQPNVEMYVDGEKIRIDNVKRLNANQRMQDNFYFENREVPHFWIKNEQMAEIITFKINAENFRNMVQNIYQERDENILANSYWIFKYKDE